MKENFSSETKYDKTLNDTFKRDGLVFDAHTCVYIQKRKHTLETQVLENSNKAKYGESPNDTC